LAGFGGDVHYLKSQFTYNYYYPVSDNVVLSMLFRTGYVVGLGEDVRLNDRFFIGGASFRGFAVRGIGPRDTSTSDALGGNFYYVAGPELSFPLGLPEEYGILGRVFSEVGSLTVSDDKGSNVSDTAAIRASAGVGLSWRSPFGPIRVDFALPILKEDGDKTESFRFSFGTRF
jgi:outer membrane protein insertion porin family